MACGRVITALCGLEVGPHPLIHLLQPNSQHGIMKGGDLGNGYVRKALDYSGSQTGSISHES